MNLAIFKSSENQDAALQFVKFMTGKEAQQSLNKTYGSLPTVKDAYDDPAFQTPMIKTFQEILGTTSAPCPRCPRRASSRPWWARR
ncbi:extracellular solute-binding protein [Streptosporangium lutulentum]